MARSRFWRSMQIELLNRQKWRTNPSWPSPTPALTNVLVYDVLAHRSPMSRDITLERTTGFEPATLTLAR